MPKSFKNYKRIITTSAFFGCCVFSFLLFKKEIPNSSASLACPLADSDDGNVDGTITISGSETFSAVAGDGTIDCSGLAVVVENGGSLALEPYEDGDTDYEDDDIGVTLMADSLTVEAGGRVHSDGLGYAGGVFVSYESGYGPGGGYGNSGKGSSGGGGAYGGDGGDSSGLYTRPGGNQYGKPADPLLLGSGGGVGRSGGNVPSGGAGGGAFSIVLSGDLVLEGEISADGLAGTQTSDTLYGSGGGSGGSIWLSIGGQLSGGGDISANGGSGGKANAGNGGGGRVLVEYGTSAYTGVYEASPGLVGTTGENGSVVVVDSTSATMYIRDTQRWIPDSVNSFENWFPEVQNIEISDNSSLKLQISNTAADSGSYGWEFDIQNLIVAAGSSISGEGLGYQGGIFTTHENGYGPGGGQGISGSTSYGAGGGHGGAGSSSSSRVGGSAYGDNQEPVTPGSGGGVGRYSSSVPSGGPGGGAVKITTREDATIDGDINFDGVMGELTIIVGRASGSGAGGSVWLNVYGTLSGSGNITARGADAVDAGAGGGGGGRIAIYVAHDDFSSGTYAYGGGVVSYAVPGAGTFYQYGLPYFSGVAQYYADGVTPIATAASLNETSVVLEVSMNHGSASETLTPEVEIREVGDDFTNTATHTGDPFVYADSVVGGQVAVTGLSDLASYHWQVRFCDSNSNCTSWQSYGANLESEADFTVILNAEPNIPSNLGPASYVDGSYGTDSTPALSFTLSDPDVVDDLQYQIQIDDTSDFSSVLVDYTSEALSQGPQSFVVGQAEGGGSYTIGSSGQTLVDAAYYWRVRAIDPSLEISPYATANSGDIAYIIDSTGPEIVGAVTGDVSKSHIVMSWTTDELSTAKVWWGKASGGYTNSTIISTLSLNHQADLSNLSTDTKYNIMIVNYDAQNNAGTEYLTSYTTNESTSQDKDDKDRNNNDSENTVSSNISDDTDVTFTRIQSFDYENSFKSDPNESDDQGGDKALDESMQIVVDEPLYDLVVYVKDRKGNLVPDALVTIKELNISVNADNNGKAVFPNVPKSVYTVSAKTPLGDVMGIVDRASFGSESEVYFELTSDRGFFSNRVVQAGALTALFLVLVLILKTVLTKKI
ncbi:hypothetical protein H6802_01050 [Candidatus Nomurabacteria bacterium]|nr:hypothetical protein [Candidatus Nomurabacteria bacterium]MCB9827326.1 hypothetical protein [Candidatus Nomurabacteria bacterium]HXK52790.1 hypothetical protein [bacterium]